MLMIFRIPLLSFFYLLCTEKDEDKKEEKHVPLLGMLSFDQKTVLELHEKIKILAYKMKRNKIVNFTDKNDCDEFEKIKLEKDKIVEEILENFKNPNSNLPKSDINIEELSKIELNRNQIEALANMFDPNGGVYVVDEKLCDWMYKILSVYHK